MGTAPVTRRRAAPGAAIGLLAALLVGAFVPAGAAVPGTLTFDAPTAEGALTEPVVYATTLVADERPARVELLTRLPRAATTFVRPAGLADAGDGRYRAEVRDTSFIAPNTTLAYRFRAILADGTEVTGPEASFTLQDERFDWRTRTDGAVTLHWYEGDDAFAGRALEIGAGAIERASQLLGVPEMPPVEFFVYADEDDFYDALGPGSRENVGGQANSETDTMVGLISPGEVASDWVDTLVAHELTHLVFAEATRNPYGSPPRWLNEGLAVYLSQGYDAADRATVERAARSGSIIPLEGLAGLFPTSAAGFSLAYAESASAIDHFVRTYGEERLVRLITSYAEGVTTDEAFRAAIGKDMRAFDDEWLASVGATRPEPYGPRPAPPGVRPATWETGRRAGSVARAAHRRGVS